MALHSPRQIQSYPDLAYVAQKLVAHAKSLHPGVPSFEGEFARFFQN
jgi:hypothetical protein